MKFEGCGVSGKGADFKGAAAKTVQE